jgi:hypothetical protein
MNIFHLKRERIQSPKRRYYIKDRGMDNVRNCDSYVEYGGCVLTKHQLNFTRLHGVISVTSELAALLRLVQKQSGSED